jgi:predicted NAD-dependent protein-ADP-ribosyltransferase YbiA (DUF1768 family)
MNEIWFTKVNLPYGWLGNMAPYPVLHDGCSWLTTEALFQAMRTQGVVGTNTMGTLWMGSREELRNGTAS